MSHVRVMVMDEAGVFYGSIVPNPDPNGKPMNTHKLYEKGAILMVKEEEWRENDYDKPVSGKNMTRIGSYRRVDDQALPQIIQPSVFTDPVKTAEAQAKAMTENAKAEAKRITDEALAAAQKAKGK